MRTIQREKETGKGSVTAWKMGVYGSTDGRNGRERLDSHEGASSAHLFLLGLPPDKGEEGCWGEEGERDEEQGGVGGRHESVGESLRP